MENFLINLENRIIIPSDIKAPVKLIKKPIDKKVPLTSETTKTLTKLMNIASQIPSSYKVTNITMLAKPSLMPGIVKDGINDSAIAITIVDASKTPKRAIFCTFMR